MTQTKDERDHQAAPAPTAEEQRRAQVARNQGAIRLMESWLANDDPADAQEQQETWAYLRRVLDEDRLSDRRLFP